MDKNPAISEQIPWRERQSIAYFRPPWNRSEIPVNEMKRVEAYINDVARFMGIAPRELVCRILTEWAYNREGN